MNNDNPTRIDIVDGIPVTSEAVGYGTDELVACLKCTRANPPDRLKCLYCGSDLELPAAVGSEIQLVPEEIEPWEKGFNVVALFGGEHDVQPATVVRAVSIGEDIVRAAMNAGAAMPVIRVRDENEARRISERFAALGLRAAVVADAALDAGSSPHRLRSIRFGEGVLGLVMFNSGSQSELTSSNIRLIVTGTIVERRSEETFQRKKKELKPMDQFQSSSDQFVIDIYAGDDAHGYRVTASGFDFSCLGQDKTLLAAENILRLRDRIIAAAPHAVFDEDYAKLQNALDIVWPPAERTSSKGFQKAGFKVSLSKAFEMSNAEQFTKYSRMRRMFL